MTTPPQLRALSDTEPDGTQRARRPPRAENAPRGGTPVPAGPTRAELHRLLRMVLEVLDGRRPAAHVERYVAHTCLQALRTRVTTRAGARQPHRLRRLYLSRPAARSVELCATVQLGERLLAAAGHVEVTRSGWRCTTLRFL